jgi:copper chaperone NosL
MITRRRFLVMLGVGAPVVGAAAVGIRLLPSEGSPTGDPQIRYGQDTCVRCSMVISDARYAAAWRDDAGKEAFFDDIGCMAHDEHDANLRGGELFVHNYNDETWTDGRSASYLLNTQVFRTPMAYGLAAFATREEAEGAGTGQPVLAWGDLKPMLDGKVHHEALHR